MGIVVFGAVFVDIKGYPIDQYIPSGKYAADRKIREEDLGCCCKQSCQNRKANRK